MQYKCPECEKYFRNKDLLRRHITYKHGNLAINSRVNTQQEAHSTSKKKRSDHERKVHPTTERATTPATERATLKGERTTKSNVNDIDESKLNEPEYLSTEIETQTQRQFQVKTPDIEDETEQPTPGYHCLACDFMLTEGENPCPNCGAQLDWSQA